MLLSGFQYFKLCDEKIPSEIFINTHNYFRYF